jgi:hypothetical protein
MIDRSGATTAHLHVSLSARAALPGTPRRLLALARIALRRLGPFGLAALDRDLAIHARLEGFDDPDVRRIVARRRTAEDVRQELLVRHYGGPRRW